ncbi:MAG: hypothetical protein ACE14P_00695 [Methanotrichaceae archaeon]
MMVGGIRYLALVTLLCMLMPPSASRMGYDIIASIPGSAIEIHRTTDYIDFSMDGSVKGSGNFSKLTHITKYAGIEAKELSASSKESDLQYDERFRLLSRYGPVYAAINLQSINLTNGTAGPIFIKGAANVVIDEAWPAYLSDYKKVSYLGPGMISIEKYDNNGDTISKYLDTWKLSKESLYQTFINRSIISINITSTSINAQRYTNRSSLYQLSQSSTGAAARLDASQRSLNGNIARVSQDYVGSHEMNLRIGMSDVIRKNISDDYWLDCCSDYSDYMNGELISKLVGVPYLPSSRIYP